jgi:hypothetical protein
MDGTPIKTIETKNRSHRETKKEKSLVPLAIIIFGAAVLLFIAFYIFLLIFNGYKFSTAKGADGSA